MVYVRDEVVWQEYVVLQCWIGLELLGSTENVQVNWGSSSTGTFSLDLLLIARSLSKSELNSAKWTQFWIKILMPDLRILRQVWCLLWSGLRNKFPCTLVSNTFNVNLF